MNRRHYPSPLAHRLTSACALLCAFALPIAARAQFVITGPTGNNTATITGGVDNITNPPGDLFNSAYRTWIQAGGTVNISNSNHPYIVLGDGSWQQSYSISAGTLNSSVELILGFAHYGSGAPSKGTFVQTGGIVNLNGGLQVSMTGSSYDMSGGTLNVDFINFSAPPASQSGFHLNGGTMVTRGFFGTGEFYFNGGTMQAKDGGPTWIAAGPAVYMSTGGARLDTAGFDRTIEAALQHKPGLSGLDGGLTKLGTGTLTLNGPISYTGPTTVEAGTLQLNGTGAGFLPDTSPVIVNGGSFALNAQDETIGALSGAGGAVDLRGRTLTLNQSTNTAYAGDFTGGGNLIKSGTGTFVLSSTNTYTGATIVNGGTLQFAKPTAYPVSGTLNVNSGATAAFNVGGAGEFTYNDVSSRFGSFANGSKVGVDTTNAVGNVTWDTAISGSFGLTKLGTGTLVLSGANTYTGPTTINAGTLQIGNGGTLGSIAGNIVNNAAVAFNRSDALSFSGVISGTGSVTKLGAGTMTLTSTNTYTGATLINGGLVEFSAANNFGTGNITINGGGIRWATGNTTDISFSLTAYGPGGATFDTNGNNVSLPTPHSGAGGITKIGAGTLTLSNANLFTGGTTVNGGTLKLITGGPTGTIRGAVTIGSGATVETAAVDAFGFNPGAKVDSVAINGGTLNNTAAGNAGWGIAYTLNNGALLTSNGGVSSSTALSAFSFGGPSGGNTSVNVTGGVNTIAGHVDLRADNGNTNVNFTVASGATLNVTAGINGGAVSLTKLGGGTMTLTGANTYPGATIISAGTLQIGNGVTTGSIPGNITNNAALVFNQAAGTTVYAGVISGSGTLTKTGPGNLYLTATSSYTGGTTVNGGVITLNGAITTTGLIGAGGSGPSSLNQITINSGNINLETDNAIAGTTPAAHTALRINQGGLLSTVNNTTKLPAITLDGGVIETAGGGNSTAGNFIFTNGLLTTGTGKTSHIVGGYIALPTAVNVGNGDTLRIGSTILGANTLTKNGPGSLVLAAPNTYSGGTSINAGTLQIGIGGTSGSVAGNITNSSVLVFDRSDAFTHPGVISGSGTLIKNGSGTLTLSGANTYTGGTTLNAGILKRTAFTGFAANTPYIVNGGTLDLGYEYTMSSLSGTGGTVGIRDGTFTLNQSVHTTYGGAIASTDTVGNPTSFIKTGTGTLTLTGASPSAPRTTILAGGLVLNGGTMTPSGAFYVGVGAASSATLTVQNGGVLTTASSGVGTSSSNNHATVTGSGSVWNTGGLIVGEIGSGNTLLIQNGGSVALTSSGTIGSQSGDFGNSVTVDGANSQLTTPTAVTIGNRGDGTLTLQNGGAISASFLRIGFQSGGSGMLNIGAYDLSSATGGGSISATSIVFGGGTGSVNFNQNDIVTLSASITGIGNVNQRGTGTTILTGASTMIGLTTVSAGTLLVNGSVASNVKVESGAILGGSGSIGGLATIQAGALLSPGNSPGTLTFTNGLTLNSDATLKFEIGTTSDLIRVSGGSLTGLTSGKITLDIFASAGFGAGTYSLFDFSGATPINFDTADFAFGNTVPGYDYTLEQSGNVLNVQVAAIPEPSSAVLLFGSVVLGLGFLRRRVR